MIRSVFFGTPEAAVPVLVGLLEVAEVSLVVTQPDRPRGRSGRLQPPPVRVAAEDHQLPVAQPASLAEVGDALTGADVAVLAAYGRLIPADLLGAPRRGFVNVHYSLLPRWRGASPVVRAILAGDDDTGVTLMEMDAGLDTGAIIAAQQLSILPEETAGELTARLAVLAGRMVADTLPRWVAGQVRAMPQDDRGATAAGKVKVAEAFLTPRLHSVGSVGRAVRAFNPRPGAWGVVDGERIKVWKVAPAEKGAIEPGLAVAVAGRVMLGCADGAVELLRVQVAGKAEMDAAVWMNGRRGEPARFE